MRARLRPRTSPARLWNSTVSSRASRGSRPDLPIGVPEEPRIAQARRDDALGVGRDRAVVGRLRVRDRQKRRHQRARSRPPPERNADDESASSSALPAAARGTPRRTRPRRPPGTRRDPALPRAAPRPARCCCSMARPPSRRACASRSRRMRSRRSMRERRTKFSVSFLRYSSKLRTLIARPARPLVARKRCP